MKNLGKIFDIVMLTVVIYLVFIVIFLIVTALDNLIMSL